MLKRKPHPDTCERCPHRYSERGCPCWMSVKETDDSTGETREKQDCFYAIMARWMTQMMKMMACDAKATCDIRNEVVMRQEALAEGMYQLMHGAPRLVDAEVLRPALEAQDAEE